MAERGRARRGRRSCFLLILLRQRERGRERGRGRVARARVIALQMARRPPRFRRMQCPTTRQCVAYVQYVSYVCHTVWDLGGIKEPEERSQYNGVTAFTAKKFPSESTEPALKFSHPLQEKEGVNAQFWEPGKRQEGGRGVIGAQSRGFRESLAFRFHRRSQTDRRRHSLQAEVAQIQTSGLVAKQEKFLYLTSIKNILAL